MALVKVYDLQNVEHEMESVDARECCKEMGWSMAPQDQAIAVPAKPAEQSEEDEPAETTEPAKRGRKPKGE